MIYTNWPDSAWYHEILFFTIAICRSKKFSVYKIYTNLKIKYQTSQFMCGSCHLGRLLNLKLVSNVKYLFTFFVFFCWIKKKNKSLCRFWNDITKTFFKSWRNLKMHFTATLKNKTSKVIRYSMPISTCNALYKWQEPYIIVDSSKFRNQNSKFRIQKSKFRIQNSKFRIQNSKFRIQNSKFRIQNSKFRIQNSIFNQIWLITHYLTNIWIVSHQFETASSCSNIRSWVLGIYEIDKHFITLKVKKNVNNF